MENTSLNKYLEDRNIKVVWNTLGHSEELIKSYIADTHHLVNATHAKQSQRLKKACYAQFYEMADRKKKTGFEKFDDLASVIKTELCGSIAQGGTPSIFVDTPAPSAIGYKEVLKDSLRDLSGDKLLYLSGGVDSEMVANALIDAGISFTPVIFNWADRSGNIADSYETDFAFTFCKVHNLTPIVRTIDIEGLWGSEEFKKLAFDVQLISAHLVTYVYMVELIAKEYPGKTHLFGGEVRYTSSFQQEDGTLSNLALLVKTMPGYNNVGGYTVQNTVGGIALFRLLMQTTGYSWELQRQIGNVGPTGTPLSGFWHDGSAPDPAGYSYNVSFIEDLFGAGGSPNPSSPTGWISLGSSATDICSVSAGPGTDTGNYKFTILIKSNTSGTFLTSYLTLNCISN